VAEAAGMVSVGVTWGFRDEAELRAHGAKHIIQEPMELLALLGAAGAAVPA
jgi:phosphoglycolate phosphatase